MNTRLAVCIPTVHDRQRSLEWARRFGEVAQRLPAGYALLQHKHYQVDRCRQVLAERALELGATHILWWDDDCLPPADGAVRLLAHAYPWCTGVYADRTGAQALGLFHPGLQPGQMLKPVAPPTPGDVPKFDCCGLGFCLMSTTLLKRLQKPWFRMVWSQDGTYEGEDFWVSRRIRGELGIQVLADPDVRVGQEELVVHWPDNSRVPVWQALPGVVERL